ncbi:MAG: germination protein YpeB [Bacillota bacterium]|nr:germination protein YpeB [Bacillota bacterium]
MNENTQSKSKAYKTALIALSIITILAILAAVYQYSIAFKYKKSITHSYNRSLSELTDSVHEIGYSLEKGMLITSSPQVVRLSNEINRSANNAIANLGQLPLSGVQSDNTKKFLTQVGSYFNSLAVQVSAGRTLTASDYSQIKNLAKYCSTLSDSFGKIQSSFYSGKLTIERLKSESNKQKDSKYLDEFISSAEENFVDYPALVYDGPFSSHIDTIENSTLQNLPEVSEKDAKNVVIKFLANDKYIIKSTGEKKGKLPSYTFAVYSDNSKAKNYITIDVTKRGGKISWFLNNYSPKDTKISVEKAMANANSFLISKGYDNMKQSYYDCRSNIATINYAYTQNGVIMYPDLVKVKIAMDTGECIGLEASGFLMNNKTRSLPKVLLSEAEARAQISSLLDIDAIQLAVIPTDSRSELLCYELKGHVENKHFLVYINAATGVEEKVMVLLESKNGILTM